eukprot:g48319.t1
MLTMFGAANDKQERRVTCSYLLGQLLRRVRHLKVISSPPSFQRTGGGMCSPIGSAGCEASVAVFDRRLPNCKRKKARVKKFPLSDQHHESFFSSKRSLV